MSAPATETKILEDDDVPSDDDVRHCFWREYPERGALCGYQGEAEGLDEIPSNACPICLALLLNQKVWR
jgi:hypothetical protein